MGLDRGYAAVQGPGELFVRHRAQEFFLPERPLFVAKWPQGGNMEADALLSNVLVGAAQAARNLLIIHLSQQADFARCPAAWTCFTRYPPVLTFGDDFLNRAPEAAGQHRIGDLA